jgi:glutamate synthase domain-containing protein 3
VFDEDRQFAKRCNTAMVALDKLLPAAEQIASQEAAIFHRGQTDEAQLRKLIEEHYRWTGSLRAREILDHWDASLPRFVKVFPHEYRRALGELNARNETAATIAKARESGKPTARA